MKVKIGNWVRDAFQTYIENHILVVPFVVLGLLDFILLWAVQSRLQAGLSAIQKGGLQTLILQQSVTQHLVTSLASILFMVLVTIVTIQLLESFVFAYTIGQTQARSKNKNTSLKAGLKTVGRGWAIFGKKLILLLIGSTISVIVFLPLWILAGQLGLILGVAIALIVFVFLMAIAFFADQTIALQNKGPWQGIVASYKFIRKHLEHVALLILFVVFLAVILFIVQQVVVRVAGFLLQGTLLHVITQGMRLILFSAFFAPYVVLLKTTYFMKNVKLPKKNGNGKKASAKKGKKTSR